MLLIEGTAGDKHSSKEQTGLHLMKHNALNGDNNAEDFTLTFAPKLQK